MTICYVDDFIAGSDGFSSSLEISRMDENIMKITGMFQSKCISNYEELKKEWKSED